MTEHSASLIIVLDTEEFEEAQLNLLGHSLLEELRGLECVAEVQPSRRIAPAEAKDAGAFAWSTLVLQLAPVVATVALSELVSFLKSWRKRPGGQPTKVMVRIGDRVEAEFNPETATSEQIRAFVDKLQKLHI